MTNKNINKLKHHNLNFGDVITCESNVKGYTKGKSYTVMRCDRNQPALMSDSGRFEQLNGMGNAMFSVKLA